MATRDLTPLPAAASRRGVFAWMLFDWANQPFQTLIVTFIFAPYFVAEVVGDPVARPGALGHRRGDRRRDGRAPRAAPRRHRRPHRGAQALGPRLLGALRPRLPRLLAGHPGDARSAARARSSTSSPSSAPSSARSSPTRCCPSLGPAPRDRAHLRLRLGARLPRRAGLARLRPPLPRAGARRRRGRSSASRPPSASTRQRASPPAPPGRSSALWYRRLRAAALPLHPRRARPPRTGRAPGRPRRPRRARCAPRPRHRSFFAFLVASMVYRDALAALFAFGGIYAAGVLGWGLFQLGVFGIVAAGIGAIGAWVGGRADRAFGPRPVIVVSIWALIAVGDRRAHDHPRERARHAGRRGIAASRPGLHAGRRAPRRRRRRAAGGLAYPPRPSGRRARSASAQAFGLYALLRPRPPPSSARR